MRTTEDRYREAGMPAPRAEVQMPGSRLARTRTTEVARRAARRAGVTPEVAPSSPLAERVQDPADAPASPESPASTTDADTEEQS